MSDSHRALIVADLEGIYDVYSLDNVEQCRNAYNMELSVYIDTFLEQGIKNIVVCDVHDKGSLLLDLCSSYEGKNIEVVATLASLNFDLKYDFAFLVGFHGMSGSYGIIPHSFRFNFKRVSVFYEKMNAYIPIGEIEVYMRWLGSKGIPVLYVSGDREAVYEGNCFNPYRETCCVKSLFEETKPSRELIFKKIRNSIVRALELDYKKCISFDQGTVRINFIHNDMLAELAQYGYEIIDECLFFDNCSVFVENLIPLTFRLIEFDKSILVANRNFLRQLKEMTSSLDRTSFEASEAGKLLSRYTIYTLNHKAREEIRACLKLDGMSGIGIK